MGEKVVRAPGPGDALLVVDLQVDFLPGGALGIHKGDRVIPPLNRLLHAWRSRDLPVFLSRDWHPPGHCSFSARGGPWPVHCVAGTPGAALSSELSVSPRDTLISKATRVDREAYSALDATPLLDALREAGITRLVIGGLATDYCVRATGLDARAAGLDVVVLLDAICGVDATPGDADRALAELAAAGCEMSSTDAVVAAMESAP